VVEQDQVRPAIAIEIDNRATGPLKVVHRVFIQVASRIVDEIQSGLIRDIFKPGGPIGSFEWFRG
jgi:hypothetical protein